MVFWLASANGVQQSLAFTLTEIFKEIPFGPRPNYRVCVNNKFHTSLDRALALYKESREKALKSIYRQKEVMKIQTMELEADLEEVSASCGHFSFSLLSYGEELKELLTILDDLQLETEERPNGRSWNWLKFWRRRGAEANDESTADAGRFISGDHASCERKQLTSHQSKHLLGTLPADTTPLMHRPILLLHLLVSRMPQGNNGWAIAYGSLLGYSDGMILSLRSKLALGQRYTHCLRLSPTLDPFILSGEVNGV